MTTEPATGGGVLTTHECAACLTAWRTVWGADEWPVARWLESVSPRRAAENRGVLEEALAEHDKERDCEARLSAEAVTGTGTAA